MKKYRIFYILSLLCVIGCSVLSAVDWHTYTHTLNSAPFSAFLMVRALEFLPPCLLFLLLAELLKHRKAPIRRKGAGAHLASKIYASSLYGYLFLSIAAPIGILAASGGAWTPVGKALAALYVVEMVLAQVCGWVAFVLAGGVYRRDDTEILLRIWKAVKLWTIPFYILNGVYSCFAWFMIVAASRGLFVIFLPVPFVVTFLLFLPGACMGMLAVRQLMEHIDEEHSFSAFHVVLQFIFVADIVSTISLLRKWRAVQVRLRKKDGYRMQAP